MAEEHPNTNHAKKCMLNMEKRVMALVVALLLLPGVSHALTDKQKPLVGLKGVEVVVEGMDPEAERLGLTRDQLKTDVELRLRKAEVRVLTMEEVVKAPGKPLLYVNVNTATKPGSPLCTYSIKVQLKTNAAVASGSKIPGVVWHTTGYGGTCKITNITRIRNVVGDQVDLFINDYLAANPK